MKNLKLSMLSFLLISLSVAAQESIQPATAGFDVFQENIPHGKIDTIAYHSNTVDSKRKAIIYTPLVIQKRRNTLFYIFCMALVEMKKNG